MTILWSVVWLVLLGTLVLWLAAEVLSQIWGWLLLGAMIVGIIGSVMIWLRWRRDRW
jgi:hypothetical protein